MEDSAKVYILRYLKTYLTCFVLFCASYAILGGDSFKQAILFQFLLFWLINELWFGMIQAPMLLIFIIDAFKNKDSKSGASAQAKRRANKLARATSVCILLIPIFVYTALYFSNKFFNGAIELWSGLAFDASLFVSSYIACILLFVIGIFAKIIGLSVMTAFGNIFEDSVEAAFEKIETSADKAFGKLDSLKEDNLADCVAAATAQQATNNTETLLESYSLAADMHRKLVGRKLAQNEEILHHSAPIRDIQGNISLRAYFLAILFGFFALIVVSMTIASFSFSSEFFVHAMLVIMSIIFVSFVLNLATSPSRVNRKLNRTDFIITNSRFILCEDGKLRSTYWKAAPSCILSLQPNGSGNIAIIKQKSFAGKFIDEFGANAEKISIAEYRGADKQLNGLVFIPQAEAVYKLIKSLNMQS